MTWFNFTYEEVAELKGLDLSDHLRSRVEHYLAPAQTDPEYQSRAEALGFVREGQCEIDDDAIVSISDGGAYVMAWVWVEDDE